MTREEQETNYSNILLESHPKIKKTILYGLKDAGLTW